MKYDLSDVQMTFYPKNLPKENIMWNQGACIVFAEEYPYLKLNEALNALVERHDQLRLQLVLHGETPSVHTSPFCPTCYPFLTFGSKEELSAYTQAFVNESMNVFGPLFRCVVFEMCGQSGVLICAHHILLDGYTLVRPLLM